MIVFGVPLDIVSLISISFYCSLLFLHVKIDLCHHVQTDCCAGAELKIACGENLDCILLVEV